MKQSRGARLKGDDDVLFSGEYWAGETSVALGLADGIGDLRSTLRSRYGEKVKMPLVAPASGSLAGLFGRKSAGTGVLNGLSGAAGLPDELISALESRAIWAEIWILKAAGRAIWSRTRRLRAGPACATMRKGA